MLASKVVHNISAQVNSLSRAEFSRIRTLWKSKSLVYGSDCSGMDGPYWACRHLISAINFRCSNEGVSGIPDPVRAFASEAKGALGDAPKRLICQNSPPKYIFDDVTQRSVTGVDIRSGQVVKVPGVTQYTAGFVCKDRSSMNAKAKQKLGSGHPCITPLRIMKRT